MAVKINWHPVKIIVVGVSEILLSNHRATVFAQQCP